MFQTKKQKAEELEALKGSAESIKAQIAEHQRWLSYQKPWDGKSRTFAHTLGWFQEQRSRYPMSDLLVKDFTKREADMLDQISAVKAEVARLQQRVCGAQ